jgi:hypothetical protein
MTRSKVLVITIFVLLIGLPGNVFALDLTKWKYQAKVSIEDGTSEYCRLALAPDVYDAARPDLADIRLVNSRSEQIPYVLVKPKDTTERQMYQPEVMNRSTSSDKAALVTLDFGRQVVKNSVEVITQGDNFRRAVKIEGSNDNIKFFTLVEQAYVFAVTQSMRFEKIDLPANDYRYLRISVSPMATEEKSPVIDEVRASKIERRYAERQSLSMQQIESREDEKSHSSIYVYDLAYRRLPISEIKLDIADDSFYRYVTVEGRDVAKEKVKIDSEDSRQRFREVEVPWQGIINDTIYRYTTDNGKKHEKLVLNVFSARQLYRYLRITINNYDDRPVTVNSASAEMISHNIVFEVVDSTAPAFYVGCESAVSPRYDFERRISNPLLIKAKKAKLSDLIDNPLFGQAPQKKIAWTERHKVLLWAVMAVVVLVLSAFILKSFKSIQKEQAQN